MKILKVLIAFICSIMLIIAASVGFLWLGHFTNQKPSGRTETISENNASNETKNAAAFNELAQTLKVAETDEGNEDTTASTQEDGEFKESTEEKSIEASIELKDTLTVKFNGKDLQKQVISGVDFGEFLALDLTYENHTDKDIIGFQGILLFKNIFGDLKKSFDWSFDNGDILANSTYNVVDTGFEINPFIDNDIWMRDTEYEKIVCEFRIRTVIFSDGTRLGS